MRVNRRLAAAVKDQTQRAAKRTLIVTVIGIMLFVGTPWIFIWALPQFAFYTQWITNYYGANNTANIAAVYQFWTVIPEIALFFIGIFWAGGIFGMIERHLH